MDNGFFVLYVCVLLGGYERRLGGCLFWVEEVIAIFLFFFDWFMDVWVMRSLSSHLSLERNGLFFVARETVPKRQRLIYGHATTTLRNNPKATQRAKKPVPNGQKHTNEAHSDMPVSDRYKQKGPFCLIGCLVF